MKRKVLIWFYFILFLVACIGFFVIGKFVWVDCAGILENGYTDEIGLGMGLVLFYILGIVVAGAFGAFVKSWFFYKLESSGFPVDK